MPTIKHIYYLVIFVTLNLTLHAQNGTIHFTIKDNIKGFGIPAQITYSFNNITKQVQADEKGRINISGLNGTCNFTFSANGYDDLKTYFTLNNNTLSVDVTMDNIDGYKSILKDDVSNLAIFEGYVYDSLSGNPLKDVDVTLSINKKRVKTNQNGYYRIESAKYCQMLDSKDTPVYSKLTFKKKGYGTHTVTNILVLPTKTILNNTLVKKGKAKFEKQSNGNLNRTDTFSPEKQTTKTPAQNNKLGSEKKNDNPSIALNATSILAGCTVAASIRVGTSCTCNNCTNVSVMSLETYVGSGLDNEWISSWNTESLKAGAVAYRSYGAYYINNPLNTNYDISSTTCKQVWVSGSVTSCLNAASATASQVLVLGSNGSSIVQSEYAAETNNFGCGDGYTGCTTCGIPSWACTSDAVCAGKTSAGHWRGMCQWGSQRWASNQAKLYTWILDHYYNPGNVYRCSATPACSPITTNDFCFGPPAPTVLNVNSTCSYISGTTCQAAQSMSPISCGGNTAATALDVWYSFTATSYNTSIKVQSGTSFDAVVELLDNACGSNLACSDATGQNGLETINYVTTLGTTYYLRVYDYNGNVNGKNFQICVYSPVCNAWSTVPTNTTLPAVSNASTFTVSTTSGCLFSKSTPNSWITLGATNGAAISYTVSANNTCVPRNGAINIYDANNNLKTTYNITQLGLTAPNCNSISGSTIACQSSTLSYSSNCSTATSYTWSVTSGLIINSGVNSNSLNVTCNTVSNNTIQIKASNACGTSTTKTISVNVIPNLNCTVGVNNISVDSVFTIYPNPTKDIVHIESNSINDGNLTVKLLNTLGQEIYLERLIVNNNSLNFTLDLRNFSAGVYFLIVTAKDKYTTKIIKH